MLATTPSRIVASLIDEGPTHRADLARKLSVSRTAVSNAVDQLLERGLVTTVPRAVDVVTLKDQICLTPGFGLVAAVVIDFDETLVGLGTLDGRLLASRALPGLPLTPGADRISEAPPVIDELREEVDPSAPLLHTQLAVNTQADRTTGEVLGRLASAAWMDVNPKRLLEESLDSPVRLENTARLLGLAEQLVRPDVTDLVYVQISYGVALGHVVDGRILAGARGGSGEIGHVSIDLEGRKCSCNGRGCLMQYLGRPAIVRRIESELGLGADIPELIRSARDGVQDARDLLAELGELTGRALAGVCNLLEPGTLVVGGCLDEAGDLFLEPMCRTLRTTALPLAVDALQIRDAMGSLVPATILEAALRCLRNDAAVRSSAISRNLDIAHTRKSPIVS